MMGEEDRRCGNVCVINKREHRRNAKHVKCQDSLELNHGFGRFDLPQTQLNGLLAYSITCHADSNSSSMTQTPAIDALWKASLVKERKKLVRKRKGEEHVRGNNIVAKSHTQQTKLRTIHKPNATALRNALPKDYHLHSIFIQTSQIHDHTFRVRWENKLLKMPISMDFRRSQQLWAIFALADEFIKAYRYSPSSVYCRLVEINKGPI